MLSKFIESFSILGSSSDINEDLVISLHRFVCLLYGDNALTSVDNWRYICVYFLTLLMIIGMSCQFELSIISIS